MAIHWQIPFKSLLKGTDYTVNIYDSTYSGEPIILKGGAQPFTTQEDENDDMFTPVRTQSGYLRIVDDGKDANGDTLSASDDWKAMMPSIDTDRPVTLTDSNGTVVWQGFMQAQNFSGVLYGNPQEREFPVQCVLTVTQGTDINYQQTEIQNFAYLLKQIVDSIPSAFRPSNFMIQGGTHAQQWLLKKMDWLNFADDNNDGTLVARFTMYDCLEDMCRFWGWTARTNGTTMYLVCADDSSETNFLSLDYSGLTTMAGGSIDGTVNKTFSNIFITGDVFVSMNNEDTLCRGHNKALVCAEAGSGNTDIDLENKKLVDTLVSHGWTFPIPNDKGEPVYFTNDVSSFNQPMIAGTSRSGYGAFALMSITTEGSQASDGNVSSVVRIKQRAPMEAWPASYGDPYVTLETKYEHAFGDGYIELTGDIYTEGNKLGEATRMLMRLGIGKTRNTAYWLDTNSQSGYEWIYGPPGSHTFIAIVPPSSGNLGVLTPNAIYAWMTRIPVAANVTGKIFVDFIGSQGYDTIDISGFSMLFTRNENYLGEYKLTVDERINRREYISSNLNSVKSEWNTNCIFASDNNMVFGYGVLINPDGTYFKGFQYEAGGSLVFPEQHLANRVTNYWIKSRRMIKTELRADKYIGAFIDKISPINKATIDGINTYPIAISHEWHDDITILTLLELQL